MSGQTNLNFTPNETVPLNAGTGSSSVKFALPSSWSADDCMICNVGSVTAFVAFGRGSATAAPPATTGTTGATPIPPGAIMTLSKGVANADTCAAITASGSAQLYFTSGVGN